MDDHVIPIDSTPGPDDSESVVPAIPTTSGLPVDPSLTVEAVPVVAVSATVTRRHRGAGVGRWAIALSIVGAIAVVSLAAIVIVAGGGVTSPLAGWAPASSAVYAELRTDLPGDQQRNLGVFLSRFPGFDDQATLDLKVDEAVAGLFRNLTGGSVDYAKDLKPWLGGEIAIAAGELGSFRVDSAAGTASGGSLVVLATAKDPDGARAFLRARVTGTALGEETYAGATLTTVGVGDRRVAWTVVGTVALAGDERAVREGLDSRSTGGLGATNAFRAGITQVTGDHLALAWVDAKAAWDAALVTLKDSMPQGVTVDPADIPAWVVATARAESDGLTLDVVAPRPTDATVGSPRESTLATRLPASTIVALEVHDAGALIERAGARAAADPRVRDALGSPTALLNGSLGSFADWVGDGAVLATRSNEGTRSGIVAVVTNETAAGQRLATIRAGLALLDRPGGGHFDATEERYADGTIVTIDLGDLRSLVGATTGTALPTPPTARVLSALPSGSTRISYTVQRGLFVLGTDPAFVKEVIDTTADRSLATVPAYQSAVRLAGRENVGFGYLDAKAAIDLARTSATLDPALVTQFDRDLGPFIAPLEGLGAAYTATQDLVHLRFALSVASR